METLENPLLHHPQGNTSQNHPAIEDLGYTEREAQGLLIKKRSDLHQNPVSVIIGLNLSPTLSYLQSSAVERPRIEDDETYVRSQKHPIMKKLLAIKKEFFYKGYVFKNGEDAHVGAYNNFLQLLGDQASQSFARVISSGGSASLYNAQIAYRNQLCEYIATRSKKSKCLRVNHFHKYPCVMVYIPDNTVMKANKTKRPSDAAFEAWVNLLLSFFIGIVNFYAYRDQIPIETQRRAGFGFLTPTLSPTGHSFRINVGIVPKDYAELLVLALRVLDDFLVTLKKTKLADFPPLSGDIFFQKEQYKKYLGNKFSVEIANVMHLLWAQVEKGGKRTVQNINRSAYARNGFSAKVFSALIDGEKIFNAFFKAVSWAIDRLSIKTSGKKTSLVFLKEGTIAYCKKFKKCDSRINDPEFWNIIEKILKQTSQCHSHLDEKVYSVIASCIKLGRLNPLYLHLELLNELLFSDSVQHAQAKEVGDGYGSDSGDESEVNGKSLFSKKIITHNGMRAIWGAIIAAQHYLAENKLSSRVYLSQAYYEVALGLSLIAKLHNANITITKELKLASMVVYDLNTCVTTEKSCQEHIAYEANKILILDATSADTGLLRQQILQFSASRAALLFLVDSGFKLQQLGADKNQYGTIRLFSKRKKPCDEYYKRLKCIEPPLLSKVSHHYRKKMKEIGAVPTIESILPKRENVSSMC